LGYRLPCSTLLNESRSESAALVSTAKARVHGQSRRGIRPKKNQFVGATRVAQAMVRSYSRFNRGRQTMIRNFLATTAAAALLLASVPAFAQSGGAAGSGGASGGAGSMEQPAPPPPPEAPPPPPEPLAAAPAAGVVTAGVLGGSGVLIAVGVAVAIAVIAIAVSNGGNNSSHTTH
jgi:hypothetical protein